MGFLMEHKCVSCVHANRENCVAGQAKCHRFPPPTPTVRVHIDYCGEWSPVDKQQGKQCTPKKN